MFTYVKNIEFLNVIGQNCKILIGVKQYIISFSFIVFFVLLSLALQFFSYMDNYSVKTAFFVGEDFDKLLFKTSILYAEAGFNVWYISFFPFEKIPDNIIIPERDVLNLITFIYLKDYTRLISHLSTTHLWHKPPRVILVSGFEKYSGIYEDKYDPIFGALIATSLLNACSVAAAKLNVITYLVITCKNLKNHEVRLNILRNLYFQKMYFNLEYNEMFEIISNIGKE